MVSFTKVIPSALMMRRSCKFQPLPLSSASMLPDTYPSMQPLLASAQLQPQTVHPHVEKLPTLAEYSRESRHR